jgi:hypothetical protein
MENMSFALALIALGFAGSVWFMRRVNRNSRQLPSDTAQSFQAKMFLPMERLLTSTDVEFLRTQPGFRPEMESQLRSARRRIFRGYLRMLERDFRTLHLAVTELVLAAPVDQSSLLRELARQNRHFQMCLLRVRAGLVLHALHLSNAPADVRNLVEATKRLSEIVGTLAPVPAAG